MTPAKSYPTLSLVMRRSGVRFSEAAPKTRGSEQPDGENFSNHVSDVCENLRQPLVSDGARTRLWATMNTETEQQTPAFTGVHNQSSTVRSAPEPPAVPSGDAQPRRIVISGHAAWDIDRHVTVYVKPYRSWQEVQGMDECKHGCKLHVRQRGAIRQYALIHYSGYGCALGRDEATRTVPVSIRPAS
jgi:hypothetical protein